MVSLPPDKSPADLTPVQLRILCRAGSLSSPTAGYARGFAQANLVVLPVEHADAFARFCKANPKPCPLLEVLPPGAFEPVRCAPGADLRTDLPRYRVLEHGRCVQWPTDVTPLWRPDFVAFLIGCSFTFEWALSALGVPVRHVEEGRNVPMFRTDRPCVSVPPFAGPLVVSMRPLTPADAKRAAHITAAFPDVHGGPVHAGDPAALGIGDLSHPHYGDAVTIKPGEIPVFWACGVTPMEAILAARLPLAITHEPGHMFVTDIPNEALRRESPE
ncbi:MAG: putative hydro-lyase [Phycisphaerales bacterium]|nr:MAG: putative hydro-lyase [Phycisphaerales bacterium]